MRGISRIVMVVVLAAVVGACGEANSSSPGLRDPGTDDFAYKPHAFDRGSWKDRMSLLRRFRSVQRDFYDGNADAVCASFNRSNPHYAFGRCVRDVKRTMERVAEGKVRWPSYRLYWVRIYNDVDTYDAIGGVTMIGPDGSKFRLGFVREGRRWLSDFPVPLFLEGLNTRMTSRSGSRLRDPGVDSFAYEPHGMDRGPLKERMELLKTFRAVQRDFFSGDSEAFCASFYRRNASFEPRRCLADVRRAMERVGSGKERWSTYRMDRVRIYNDAIGDDDIGGVSVSNESGDLIRLAFVRQGRRWRSNFMVPMMLEGLNTRLTRGG